MNILVIDDEKALADHLVGRLNAAGHRARAAYNGADGLASARDNPVDLVICALGLPDMHALGLMPLLLAQSPDIKVIVMTGCRSPADAVATLRAGAEVCLEKPFDMDELLILVEKLGLRLKTELALGSLKLSATRRSMDKLRLYMGEGMQKVYQDLALASAEARVPVLLLGETGSGKEHAARLLHQLSARFAGPFVELNCASLPETLVDAELFGAEAGAYTDAKLLRRGLFEAAQGGTLFLDEIGELSAGTQAKLLKVLEDHKLRRVGSTEVVGLNLRVVAATNKDLAEEVHAGRFRSDLYFRLSTFSIHLPALRQRREDIPALARFLFERACLDYGRRLAPLDGAQLAELSGRDWPGNVRELRNVLESAVLRAQDGRAVLGPDGLSPRAAAPAAALDLAADGLLGPLHEAVDQAVRKVKLDLLTRALTQCKGNKTAAAKLLQIDYKTIANLKKSLGMA